MNAQENTALHTNLWRVVFFKGDAGEVYPSEMRIATDRATTVIEIATAEHPKIKISSVHNEGCVLVPWK